MKTLTRFLTILFVLFWLSCEKEEEINSLAVSKEKIEIPANGGNASFTIKTDEGEWNIDNPATDWIDIPITSGKNYEALISLSVDSKTLVARTDTLTVTAGNAFPVYVIVTQPSSEYLYSLTTNRIYAHFGFASENASMNIISDAPEWNLTCDAEWVQLSQHFGGEGTFSVTIGVSANTETTERSTTIYLTGDGAPSSEIAITQKGTYPSYNTNPIEPDMTGISSNAVEIAGKKLYGSKLLLTCVILMNI